MTSTSMVKHFSRNLVANMGQFKTKDLSIRLNGIGRSYGNHEKGDEKRAKLAKSLISFDWILNKFRELTENSSVIEVTPMARLLEMLEQFYIVLEEKGYINKQPIERKCMEALARDLNNTPTSLATT